MERKIHVGVNLIVTGAFVVFAYWITAVKNGFMLRWYDEMSLFEPTRIFFRQFLHYPGGLLRWAGTWLTQLLYHRWLGSSALIALWLLLAWLTKKAFRLSECAAPLAMLVPVAMLVSVVQMDEAWLSMKSAGYVFSNTLGYIFTVLSVFFFRKASSRPVPAMIIAAITALCYPFAGFYALLGSAICAVIAVISAVRDKQYLHFATAAAAVGLIIVAPCIYYSYFHGNTADNDYLYLRGLPELTMEAFDLYLWMPFIVATAVLLLIAVISGFGWLTDGGFLKWTGILALCCGFAWGVSASQKSEQLRATVLMLQRLDRGDWQGMAAIMSRIKEPPNYTMRILNNLALVNLGQKGESMAGYTPAPGDGRHSEKFTMTAFVQVPLYYSIGRFNQSQRWAMEHTVQYGKRVFFLKYMVKDALLRGEIPLARRYNDILKSTMFHRKWAEGMERYIENPELIDSDIDMKRILQYGEGERKRSDSSSTAEIH